MEVITCVRCGFDLVHHADGRIYRVTCPECGEDDAARLLPPKAGPWSSFAVSLLAAGLSAWLTLDLRGLGSALAVVGLAGLGGTLAVISVARAWTLAPRRVIDLDVLATTAFLPLTGGWMLFIAWAAATNKLQPSTF